MLKVVTLNVLNDLRYWEARGELILQWLRQLQPDIINFQEICLPENNAAWITERLEGYSLHLAPARKHRQSQEALAILSRLPVESHDTLKLGLQSRIAHQVIVRDGVQRWMFVNTHLLWSPLDDHLRIRQIERILNWLPHDLPTVICGDFNSLPHYRALKTLSKQFTSAYRAVHGVEPAYTFPTPLKRGPGLRHSARSAALSTIGPMLNGGGQSWRGTLDYIFVNHFIEVRDCTVAFDLPSPADDRVYPSDHFGLAAELGLRHPQ
jgi:endonuclease/exonuclease/phosphatase family metal-dependent hydrolase